MEEKNSINKSTETVTAKKSISPLIQQRMAVFSQPQRTPPSRPLPPVPMKKNLVASQALPLQKNTELEVLKLEKRDSHKDDSFQPKKELTQIEQATKRMSYVQELMIHEPLKKNVPEILPQLPRAQTKRTESFGKFFKEGFNAFKQNLVTTTTQTKSEAEKTSQLLLRQRSKTTPVKPSSSPSMSVFDYSNKSKQEMPSSTSDLNKKQPQKEDPRDVEKKLQAKYKELIEFIKKHSDPEASSLAQLAKSKKYKSAKSEQLKLMYEAYKANNTKLLDTYFEKNCDPNDIFDNGKTLLHFAAEEKNILMLKYLLSNAVKQANPNISDDSGSLPLHYAAKNNDLDSASLLLWRNKQCISNALTVDNPTSKKDVGRLPRNYLNSNDKNYDQLVRLLEHAEVEANSTYRNMTSYILKEFESLSAAKEAVLKAFLEVKELQNSNDILVSLCLITNTIETVTSKICDSILLHNQKLELLKKVNLFSKGLFQDIIIHKPNPSKSKLSEVSSPTRKESTRFGLTQKVIPETKRKDEKLNQSFRKI